MRKASRVVAFASLALLSAPSLALGSPLGMFGASARTAAMGLAQTASAEDATASYSNPALLANLETVDVMLSYSAALPKLTLNDADLQVDSSRGTHLALAAPGTIFGKSVGLGVSMFLPDHHLLRYRSLSQEQPRFALYDNRAQRLVITASAAVAITSKLNIGGGVGFLTSTVGDVNLVGRIGFPDAASSDIFLDMDVSVTQEIYANAGASYQAMPWLRVAGMYRASVQPVTDLSVNVIGDIGAANVEPIVEAASIELRSRALNHFQPAEFAMGFYVEANSRLAIAGDLVYQRWSAYKNPAATLDSTLDLGQFNEFFDQPEDLELAPANFKDIVIPRIGAEYRAYDAKDMQLDARLGYAYERSPAPEQKGITNFADNNKHTLSGGMGVQLDKISEILLHPIAIDLSAAWTTLRGRNHRKSSPTDPVGDYRSDGNIFQVQSTLRVRF